MLCVQLKRHRESSPPCIPVLPVPLGSLRTTDSTAGETAPIIDPRPDRPDGLDKVDPMRRLRERARRQTGP